MIPIIEKLLKNMKEHYFLKLTFYDINVITLKSIQKKKPGNKLMSNMIIIINICFQYVHHRSTKGLLEISGHEFKVKSLMILCFSSYIQFLRLQVQSM